LLCRTASRRNSSEQKKDHDHNGDANGTRQNRGHGSIKSWNGVVRQQLKCWSLALI
jgi:hypothetical protein